MSQVFGRLGAGDIGVIAAYFVLTLAVGFWTICRPQSNISGYFLARRTMKWWPVGMSLFASNIGSDNFIGIAGTGAASGLAVIMFEWNAVWLLILLGWVFLPVYVSSGIYTIPEYLQRRFGGDRLRIYLSLIAIITYITVILSTDLYAGAIFINQTLQWNLYVGVTVILVIAMVFSALGGLKTVMLTDAVAVAVMLIGGFVVMIIGFIRVGGMTSLREKYMTAVSDHALNNTNSSCGYPRHDAWHIFRHPWKSDFPWVGTFLLSSIGSLWFWCGTQLIVQRAIAAKNLSHAKGGTILAGYLKLLPMFIMIFPGMISRVLFPNEVACSDAETCMNVCGVSVGCSNIAIPRLVAELLPDGLRGLIVAAMVAAVVSTLTSIFNSCTTLFTLDIWNKLRPKASEFELLLVGRCFVVVTTALSVVWIPIMKDQAGGQIFFYTTSILGLLGAPTCAVFILALFWKRTNEQGAFWGLVIAQCWGLVRFVLGFIYPDPACGELDNRPSFLKDWHPHYHAVSQIVLAFIICVIVTLVTKPAPAKRIAGLTYWTRFEKQHQDYIVEKLIEESGKADGKDNMNEQEENQTSETEICIVEENAEDDKRSEKKEAKMQLKARFVKALLGDRKSRDLATDCAYEPHSERMKHLKQTPFWNRFLNAQMVILMCVTAFCYVWWR